MHNNVRGTEPGTDQGSQDVQYSFSPHSNQEPYQCELKREIAQYNKSFNNPSVQAKPLLFRLLNSSARLLANSASSCNRESTNKKALHELENVLNEIHLFYYSPDATVSFDYKVVLTQCCNALVHLCEDVSLLPPAKRKTRSTIDNGIALISCAIHLVHKQIEGTPSAEEGAIYTRDSSITKHMFSFNNAALILSQTVQVSEYAAIQRDMQVASCIARILNKDSLYEYRIQLSQHLALRIDNIYSAILNRRPLPTFKHSFHHDIDLLNTAHTLLTNSLNKLSRRASKNISIPSSIALIQLDIFNCRNLGNTLMNNKNLEHSYYFDSICDAFQPCPVHINRLRTVLGNAYLSSKISKYGRESLPVMETIQNNLESADKLLDNDYFSYILRSYPRSQYSELRKTVTSALETLYFFYFAKASSKHASYEKIPSVMSSSSHASDSKTLKKSTLYKEKSDKPSTSHLSLKTLKKIPAMLALKATANSRKKNFGPRSNSLHVREHTSESSSNNAAEVSIRRTLTDHATSSALDIDFAARQSIDYDLGGHETRSSKYRMDGRLQENETSTSARIQGTESEILPSTAISSSSSRRIKHFSTYK
ncbi:hypothetical protein [Anaplasma phagocytophilum]|uniref:HGE-14 protein n=3 Tax=Anaplasma phagocytophilum TaxID=948 RepID=Q2GJR7_ANAPZ|nr:hypothetical protein [Anaplasma phagocytophilum]KJZ99189.1 hypothetical protein APHCR_0312 [Anaplasma phagocytophilum str. CR1007]ABD44033.1 hypothetical protein APH_0807 [Anaplasma phagocytophilum str. HZ]AGR79485.1 hypothetical protein YYU_03760 [Anaplasma phagocytophilum str. HZ2]AGR81986.1 hypothetical protein YYY_03750 [Anaplasma phagocytophilum str. Dog2]EOA61089.1 hypothetical protein HGE1_03497 [Anaplasma phagocytophilum str. HGE1]